NYLHLMTQLRGTQLRGTQLRGMAGRQSRGDPRRLFTQRVYPAPPQAQSRKWCNCGELWYHSGDLLRRMLKRMWAEDMAFGAARGSRSSNASELQSLSRN